MKTPVLTASPFLFEHYRKFLNLLFDESTSLTSVKSQSLKNFEKFHNTLMITFLSNSLVFAYHRICFLLRFLKFMNTHMLVYIWQKFISILFFIFHCRKVGYHIAFMIAKFTNRKNGEKQSCNLTVLKLSTFLNHRTSLDTKISINPALYRIFFVNVDLLSICIVTVPTPKKLFNMLQMQYFVTGFLNLILLIIWLQIGKLNILILKWQFAVLCSIFVIIQELHMLLVQPDLLKYKINFLEPIWQSFYMIPLKIGLSKYICLPMLTLLNLYHICTFPQTKEFFIRSRVFH